MWKYLILEERSVMTRKILDAVAAVVFGTCLVTTSSTGALFAGDNIVSKACVVDDSTETYENDMTDKIGTNESGILELASAHTGTSELGAIGIETRNNGIDDIMEEHISIERNNSEIVTTSEGIEAVYQEEAAYVDQTVVDAGETEFFTENPVEVYEEVPAEPEPQEQTVAGYTNRWGIILTEEEINLLACIVWVESRGESSEGQQAVVEVVFNRMISERYPNNLYDVLSQKSQFASWRKRGKARPTNKEYESIYRVLAGETAHLRADTLYFARRQLTSNLDIKIGGHNFCY
jgi:N-acetylmuramoyl-L-alanine amidase